VPLLGGGIHRRLLMWGLGLFGIALTAVIVAGYSYTSRQIEQDAAQLQAEIASVTADRIHTFVRRKIERFSDLAAAVSLYGLGSKEQQLLTSLLVKNDGSFTDVSIIDARGMEVVKVSDRRVYFRSDLSDQSRSAKFNKAIKGENYISRVYTSDQAQPYVTVAIPLWGTAQSVVGVVSAEADLSFLWEAIGEIRFGTAGYAYLIDEQGNLIAHKDPLLVLKKMNLRQADGVQKFLRNPTRLDPSPARKGRGLLDRPVLSTYAPVPELGWAVILEEPLEAALANVEILRRYALALLAISLFVGAVVIAWVSSKMAGPIRELHEGAEIIGSGNLDYRVNIETGDEIEWLGEEFNKMAAELKVLYATLEQKVKDKTAELEQANSELEQMAFNLRVNLERIQALHEINLAATSTLDLKGLLNLLLEKIDRLLPYSFSTVRLWNRVTEELEPVACRNLDEEEWKRETGRGRSGISRAAFETKMPVRIDNLQKDPRTKDLDFFRKKGMTSFLGLPLIAKGEALGVIGFYTRGVIGFSREERPFSNEEVDFLSTLASQAAIAIHNSQLYEETKRANEVKTQFLSVMSHELRTPLNVIMGYAGIMKDGMLGEVNPEQEKSMGKVMRQTNDLLAMITSILEVTKMEAGATLVERQEVYLTDFLNSIKSLHSLPLDKDVTLHWDYPSDLPVLMTDSGKLKQILYSLINNAIKFTERGQVTLSARHLPEAKTVEFQVKDTGIGIKKELLSVIFERFRQADSSETRNYGGVGLGLYIVKQFTDLLGGKVEVESEPSKGSTFTVTIPALLYSTTLTPSGQRTSTTVSPTPRGV